MTTNPDRIPDRDSWTGERRVTVDLDDSRPFDVCRTWKYLEAAGAHEIEARVSAGGEGFHVRAWFEADDVDKVAVERLRLGAGDHPRRVRMDRKHHVKPGQVLFTRKHDGEAGPWRESPWRAADDLLRRSERFDSTDPRDPYRGWFK